MTGQDWMEKDFYAVLGVSKDADDAAIKKAYRKLARQYHPDQNQGNAAAETKFKEIGEAYAVLSDAEQRRQYDAVRAMARRRPLLRGSRRRRGRRVRGHHGRHVRRRPGHGRPGRTARPLLAGRGRGAGFEDILGSMFGGGRSRLRLGRPDRVHRADRRRRHRRPGHAAVPRGRRGHDSGPRGQRPHHHGPDPGGDQRRQEDPPARQGPAGRQRRPGGRPRGHGARHAAPDLDAGRRRPAHDRARHVRGGGARAPRWRCRPWTVRPCG